MSYDQGHVAVISIGVTWLQSTKAFARRCRVIIAIDAYIDMERNLAHCARRLLILKGLNFNTASHCLLSDIQALYHE